MIILIGMSDQSDDVRSAAFDETKGLFPSFSMAKRLAYQLEEKLERNLGRKPSLKELVSELERVASSYKAAE